MRVSSHDLVRIFAERLNDVLPTPCRLQADGAEVSLFIGEDWDTSMSPTTIMEDASRELVDRIDTFLVSALSLIQDGISEHTRTPWPTTDGRKLALPRVRFDGTQFHMWFGDNETAPVLRIAPISLSSLIRAG
jgi:hypothetical protein